MSGERRLVEQTEAHVIVRLLGGLFLLLLSSSLRSSTTSGSTRSSWSTSWHSRQLLGSLSNQLLDVLAIDLSQQSVNLLVLNLNGDRLKDLLDVSGRWGSVTGVNQQ
ncbi:hypothetical protein QG37_01132 [Candidozyma auris]|nr:hypothetical protein QG37_01132 [[Candida] auris]